MPEPENKNKIMNDYIKKQAGMEEIPEPENKNMNDLIRKKYSKMRNKLLFREDADNDNVW